MHRKLNIFTVVQFFAFFCFGQKSINRALNDLPVLVCKSKIPIVILGTFHFNFSQNESDFKGADNFDVYSEKRQNELKVLIEELKTFNPTKIAVELMPSNQTLIDSLYQAYIKGTYKLGKNEVFQVGFRLAKELGLNGVNCVDTRPKQLEVDTTISDWEVYAKERGELEKWEAYNEPNKQLNTYIELMRAKMSMNDYLIFLNDDKVKRRYKQFFLTGLVEVGAGHTYIGSDLTGYWYRRNTRIFANIKRLVTSENDRILVIYGNSHAWVLEELFSASPEFKTIPVDKIIK